MRFRSRHQGSGHNRQRRKRVLISFGVGLLIIPLMMALLLTIKIISPNTYPTWFFWIFLWTYPLLCRIPNLKVTGGNIILFGLLGDYLISSFLTYLCLSVRSRLSRRRTPLPPPPAVFLTNGTSARGIRTNQDFKTPRLFGRRTPTSIVKFSIPESGGALRLPPS